MESDARCSAIKKATQANEKHQHAKSKSFLLPDTSYIFTCIHILSLFATVKNSFSLGFQIKNETTSLEAVKLLSL